ncbi:AraC-like ligand-binding domain-containing protein [Streptomyces millisiae]|uniref:Helix-turn-helix domain-containing protein n=1 Tax=Streptomyces millisiae TaxID=3075542 RepID=A0ABU2LHB9_9ACTN|nr:helix-turn-helix domain-containing protein [Streptomyces sp. DSM 44918]MDT0316987.1 helix-turn-helix domain-containing protein [Streptomyces sp. DSM 44918]
MFDSDALPPGDRVDAWHEVVARSLIANRMHIERPDDFHASMRAAQLGAAYMSVATYPSLRSLRTERMIKRSDPELYMLASPLRGRYVFAQARRQALIEPGDFVVFPTFRPYEGIVRAGDGAAGTLVCTFPRGLLPMAEKTDGLWGRRLPGEEGIGGLLRNFLTQLAGDAQTQLPGDGPRLGVVLLDLISAMLAHHVEAEERVPPESRQRVLYAQILAFIQRNLADPDLTPTAIAAAHHVSLRSLHRLFHDHGHSVTAHIRQERLERARRDLTNHALGDRPIHAIAARWGFTHHAAFTRAFHTTYGTSPRDYRLQAHGRATPGRSRAQYPWLAASDTAGRDSGRA